MHFISRGLVFQTGQMQMDNTEKKKDGRMEGGVNGRMTFFCSVGCYWDESERVCGIT